MADLTSTSTAVSGGPYFATYNNAGVGEAGSVPGANNFKTEASSKFGTRILKFLNVAVTNIHVSPTGSDSLFSRTLRAAQQIGELYVVGTPSSGNVVIVVADDTMPTSGPAFDTDATPTVKERLEAALLAGGVTGTVTEVGLVGNALA
jgi:hypothetical protein